MDSLLSSSLHESLKFRQCHRNSLKLWVLRVKERLDVMKRSMAALPARVKAACFLPGAGLL